MLITSFAFIFMLSTIYNLFIPRLTAIVHEITINFLAIFCDIIQVKVTACKTKYDEIKWVRIQQQFESFTWLDFYVQVCILIVCFVAAAKG